MSIERELEALIERFSRDLLALVRRSSADEVATMLERAPSPEGSRYVRGPEEIAHAAARIVALVARHPGIDAKELKKALGLPKGRAGQKRFDTPLHEALAAKQIRKTGRAASTKYFPA